jgi:ubiquinone biosynthesis protein UbiJ
MFDPRAAEGLDATFELRFGEDVFCAVVADGKFEVERGTADRPDATVMTDSEILAGLVYEGRDLAAALRSGDLKIEGDRSAVERFVGLFPLLEPAPPGVGT